uniref:Single-stranded DNA-binding protein, mitochondrial (inferred by orthology to a C. elegans protein) n=1 Tax=Strongyloides venezuelensis TaxID=75913 RepID=A0A0K0FGF9_STRVS
MIRRGLTLLSATRFIPRNARPLSLSAVKLSENVDNNFSEEKRDTFSIFKQQDHHSNNAVKNRAYSMNQVQLIGGVTQDPITKISATSNEYCVLKVATNINYKKANGETVVYTDFHDVYVFRGSASFVKNNVKKGHRVFVTGRLSYNQISSPDGFKYDKAGIVADTIQHFGVRLNKEN